MKRLVGVVRTMRQGIKSVVRIAEGVKDSVREVVPNGSGAGMDGDHGMTSSGSSSSDQFQQERKLAEVLAAAFQERNEASARYEAIQDFMQKFDLSDQDSSLLEHYNFEGILDPGSSSAGVNSLSNYGSHYDKDQDEDNEGQQAMKDGLAFLDALKRVTKIRKELSTSFESSSTSSKNYVDHDAASRKLGPASAMRMVENLATKQDAAFERLYHFLHSRLDLSQASVANVPTSSSSTQSQFMHQHHQHHQSLNIQDGMDETLLHPFIKKSIVVLHQVPAYYKHTLELIATSRRAEVTRKFLLALTSGYDGMPPIEMKAHDPVNYVGDMLAFVFRTMSVESELARGLFKDDDDGSSANDANGAGGKKQQNNRSSLDDNDDDDDDNNAGMCASDVLNDIVSGVARPLKSRLSQVTTSLAKRPDDDLMDDHMNMNVSGGLHDEEASMSRIRLASLYSICGLLLFYKSAMEKAAKRLEGNASSSAVGKGETLPNPLVACLTDCIEDAAHAYVLSLKVHVATLESLASLSRESQASVANEVITRLCDVRAASPGYGIESEHLSNEIANFLSLEYLCDTVFGAVLPKCTKLDESVSIKMALNSVKKFGLRAECASSWDKIISENVQTAIDEQIASDTKDVLDECSLASVMNAIENMKAVHIEGMVASSHSGLSKESLEKAIKFFYASLFDPPIPSYSIIKDPVLKKYARNKVADNVTEAYRQIYELAKSDNGGYSDLSFLTYDPDQVKSMLSS